MPLLRTQLGESSAKVQQLTKFTWNDRKLANLASRSGNWECDMLISEWSLRNALPALYFYQLSHSHSLALMWRNNLMRFHVSSLRVVVAAFVRHAIRRCKVVCFAHTHAHMHTHSKLHSHLHSLTHSTSVSHAQDLSLSFMELAFPQFRHRKWRIHKLWALQWAKNFACLTLSPAVAVAVVLASIILLAASAGCAAGAAAAAAVACAAVHRVT